MSHLVGNKNHKQTICGLANIDVVVSIEKSNCPVCNRRRQATDKALERIRELAGLAGRI